MNTSLRFLALLSLVTLALPGRAADTPGSAQVVTPAPTTVQPPGFVNFNVDFPGGPIGQLITALAKVDGVSLNIIGVNEAADFPQVELPAFSLRNVNLLTLVEVLQNFLAPRGFDLRQTGGITNPNSMVLMLRRVDAPKPPKYPPTEFRSYRLSPFLEVQSVDDIVGAIRAGWELDPAHDPKALHLKFHPGTSILLVSGPNDALGVTDSVIRNLKRNPDSPAKPDPKSPPAADSEKK